MIHRAIPEGAKGRRNGTSSSLDHARSLVAALLEGVLCPPTDLSAVAERLEVPIVYERITGAGELRRLASGFQIVCNSTLPASRSRFTIAHELGHVVLARNGYKGKQEGKTVERFCDVVATELLMPAHIFGQDLHEELTLSRLLMLKERYETSLQATAYRCAEIGNVTVIEARAGTATIVRGPLRNSTALDDQTLRDLVKRACRGSAGSTRVYLRHNNSIRLWNVLRHPLQRPSEALLLISPVTE